VDRLVFRTDVYVHDRRRVSTRSRAQNVRGESMSFHFTCRRSMLGPEKRLSQFCFTIFHPFFAPTRINSFRCSLEALTQECFPRFRVNEREF